jgi:tetratricopeptide (TPR) repeat protein
MSKIDKEKALQLLYEDRLKEAYEAFSKLLPQYQEDWVIFDGLAYLEMYFKKNLEQAEHFIKKARELGCPDARYHSIYAKILWRKGQLQEARLQFEKAVAVDRSVDNLTALANSLMKNDYDSAVPIWQEITEKDSNNVDAYLALAWIAGKHNDWALSLETAAKAEELQHGNAKTLYYLGRAFRGLGEYEKALEHYLEADKLGYAEKFFFYGDVANCYFELHDYTKAPMKSSKSSSKISFASFFSLRASCYDIFNSKSISITKSFP